MKSVRNLITVKSLAIELALSIFTLSSFTNISDTPDSRLFDVYSTEFLNNLSNNQPGAISFLNFQLDNSYRVMDFAEKANGLDYPNLSSVQYKEKLKTESKNSDCLSDFNSNSLNVLKYQFNIQVDKRTYYRVDGTNNFLVFYSSKELRKKFNNQDNN